METVKETTPKNELIGMTAEIGKTVLEFMADYAAFDPVDNQRPPQTPPIPTQTTTRSGEGYAQIADDQMTDHLYE